MRAFWTDSEQWHRGRLVFAGLLLLGGAVVGGSAAVNDSAAAWVVAMAVWAIGWFLWPWKAASRRATWAAALALRLVWAPVPIVLSDDAYRYVWDGLAVIEGVNPYATRPVDEPLTADAPWLRSRMNSASYHSVYPPVSQATFVPAALAYRTVGDGPEGWAAAMWTLKATFALVELALLIWLSRRVPHRTFARVALLPLLVVDGFGQPHTDLLAMSALALALGIGSGAGRLAALALAGWVKLWPGLLALGHDSVARRQGRRPPWYASVGVTLAALAIGLPLVAPGALSGMWASLDLYVRYFEFNAGPYEALKWIGRVLTGADVGKSLGPVLRAAFGVWMVVVLVLSHWRRWPLARTAWMLVLGYLATATTVHPWYLLPVVPLLALDRTFAERTWPWLAFGLLSTGSQMTYAFYRGTAMTPFVWLGWGGASWVAVATLWRHHLPKLLAYRARQKLRWIRPCLPPDLSGVRILDLGAGEGFVGLCLADEGAHVTLADVAPVGQVELPFVVLREGEALPFGDRAFDVVLLLHVLHHAHRPEALLREALRVGQEVVILESVYETPLDRAVLSVLDRAANTTRGDWMLRQPLAFRRAGAWVSLAEGMGSSILNHKHLGRFPHRQLRLRISIDPLLQSETS